MILARMDELRPGDQVAQTNYYVHDVLIVDHRHVNVTMRNGRDGRIGYPRAYHRQTQITIERENNDAASNQVRETSQ